MNIHVPNGFKNKIKERMESYPKMIKSFENITVSSVTKIGCHFE